MKELKITKGVWRVSTFSKYNVETEDGRSIASSGTYSTNTDNGEHIIENEANARLIAESGTVANQCGLTPKELLEQRNELLKIAKHLAVNMKAYGNERNGKRWFETMFKTKLSYLKENFDIEV